VASLYPPDGLRLVSECRSCPQVRAQRAVGTSLQITADRAHLTSGVENAKLTPTANSELASHNHNRASAIGAKRMPQARGVTECRRHKVQPSTVGARVEH